ncbi:MAG: tetratricopeptide repeat protein [Planctomycetota bacterium]|jgi:tetratricopeptide (TPR) repeat protein
MRLKSSLSYSFGIATLIVVCGWGSGVATGSESCGFECTQQAKALLNEANQLLSQEKYQEAAQKFEEAISMRPGLLVVFHATRGATVCMENMQKTPDALACHDREIAIANERLNKAAGRFRFARSSHLMRALARKMRFCGQVGLVEQERQLFRQLRADYPFSSAVIDRIMVDAVQKSNDPVEAKIQHYQEVINATQPSINSQRAALAIARLLSESVRFQEAIAYCNQSITTANASFNTVEGFDKRVNRKWKKRALFEKSRICCRLGLMEEARGALQQLKDAEYERFLRPIDKRIIEKAVNEGANQGTLDQLYSQEDASEQIIERANQAANQDNFDEAISLLNQVIASYPGPIAEDANHQKTKIKVSQYKRRANELIIQTRKSEQEVPNSEWDILRSTAAEVIQNSNHRGKQANAKLMIIESYFWQGKNQEGLSACEEFHREYDDIQDWNECKKAIAWAHFFHGLILRKLNQSDNALNHFRWVITASDDDSDDAISDTLLLAIYYQRWLVLYMTRAPEAEISQAADDILLRFPDSGAADYVQRKMAK